MMQQTVTALHSVTVQYSSQLNANYSLSQKHPGHF